MKHGLIKYIDSKAKCRYLKKFTFKGTLRQVFIKVYTLEIQSVMLVFSTQLCKPSLWVSSPPPPFPRVKVQYLKTVCGWEGWGSDQIQNLQIC